GRFGPQLRVSVRSASAQRFRCFLTLQKSSPVKSLAADWRRGNPDLRAEGEALHAPGRIVNADNHSVKPRAINLAIDFYSTVQTCRDDALQKAWDCLDGPALAVFRQIGIVWQFCCR